MGLFDNFRAKRDPKAREPLPARQTYERLKQPRNIRWRWKSLIPHFYTHVRAVKTTVVR